MTESELKADEKSFDFVSGFRIVEECVWPMILHCIDSQLSFVVNQSNLLLFRHNYQIAMTFIKNVQVSDVKSKLLIDKFNL